MEKRSITNDSRVKQGYLTLSKISLMIREGRHDWKERNHSCFKKALVTAAVGGTEIVKRSAVILGEVNSIAGPPALR